MIDFSNKESGMDYEIICSGGKKLYFYKFIIDNVIPELGTKESSFGANVTNLLLNYIIGKDIEFDCRNIERLLELALEYKYTRLIKDCVKVAIDKVAIDSTDPIDIVLAINIACSTFRIVDDNYYFVQLINERIQKWPDDFARGVKESSRHRQIHDDFYKRIGTWQERIIMFYYWEPSEDKVKDFIQEYMNDKYGTKGLDIDKKMSLIVDKVNNKEIIAMFDNYFRKKYLALF